jgi:mutator protein MutT
MASILGEYGDKIIAELSQIFKSAKKKDGEVGKKQLYADTIIRNSQGELLLLQRSNQDDFGAGKWSLAGGKMEEGEQPQVAAARELEEETGISLSDIKDFKYLKTIEKEDCVINYFQAVLRNDTSILVLDNGEHWSYSFVPEGELGNYDLLLDLNEVLTNELLPELDLIDTPLEFRELTPEEKVGYKPLDHDLIVKAFDEGLMEDDDFSTYLQIKGAIETITKAYDCDQITTEQFFNALEKGKHYEFVRVVRDNKTFYQYREVGTDKIEEDVEEGTTVETNAILDLKITKYSDKSILITGNTYKNLQLLRDAKTAAGGYGTFNKALGGWIFPSFAKDKIIALMADKMSIDTYDETVAKEQAIEVKNTVDIGTEVETGGEIAEVKEVSTNDIGKVEITVETKKNSNFDNWMISSEEADDTPTDEIERLKGQLDYSRKSLEEAKEAGDKGAIKEFQNLVDDYEKQIVQLLLEKAVKEAPIGSVSPDGKYIKTANGWEYNKTEKKVTEEDVAIPAADEKKAEELINNVTEESRFKTGKMLFGKEAGEQPVSVDVQAEGSKGIKAEVKEFTTRSGEKVQALDYGHIKPKDIMLVEQEGLLDRARPDWCPVINEKNFYGWKDDSFLFDYVKLDDDHILLSVNGFDKSTVFAPKGKPLDELRLVNEELKNDVDSIPYYHKRSVVKTINEEKGIYKMKVEVPNGKEYTYNSKEDLNNDEYALLNNQEASYAVVSVEQLVAIQDYYVKRRKADIELKKSDEMKRASVKLKDWDESMLKKYYPYDYDKRLSDKQKKKYTKEQWEALSIDEKIAEVPAMKYPAITLPKGNRISQLEDTSMWGSNFRMYKKFVDHSYLTPTDRKSKTYDHEDACYKEYQPIRDLIKWKRLDMAIQREENAESYKKGYETSYGDSNTKDDILDSHGVKVKSQSGKKLNPDQIVQISDNLSKVYNSFGDRSKIAKDFGLKISHAGEKKMYASQALGMYVPSMKAIGVSNNQEHDKFGFTLAHEFAHFIDNHLGEKQGRNYASDNHNSTAGKIAYKFRELMNKGKFTDSDYANRTCECFARALEQYHAMKHEGDDAIKSRKINKAYHQEDGHVNKQYFNTEIKPLIEQFFQENDHLLKSAVDELDIIDVDGSFELIKSAFDNEQLDVDTFIGYVKHYEEIKKAEDKDDNKPVSKEPVSHSKAVLAAFAKETSAKELKRIIAESHDEKLRKAAHKELDRRERLEKKKKQKV